MNGLTSRSALVEVPIVEVVVGSQFKTPETENVSGARIHKKKISLPFVLLLSLLAAGLGVASAYTLRILRPHPLDSVRLEKGSSGQIAIAKENRDGKTGSESQNLDRINPKGQEQFKTEKPDSASASEGEDCEVQCSGNLPPTHRNEISNSWQGLSLLGTPPRESAGGFSKGEGQ